MRTGRRPRVEEENPRRDDPVPPAPAAVTAQPASLAEPTPPRGTPAVSATPEPGPLEVPHTRTSATYIAVAAVLVLLVLVLDFIIQNLHNASVHFFTVRVRLPVGLLILAATVAGGIIVFVVSLARVAQLRLMARRHQRAHRSA